MEKPTETRQELFYKIMMMRKILRQKNDPSSNKKTPILSKTRSKIENCVSTNLTVAINSKIIKHIITPDKIKKIITCRKQKLDVNIFHNMTHPKMDSCYISQNLTHKTDYTHSPKCNSLDQKESALWLTQYNISYRDSQQGAQGKREKAIAIKEKKSTDSKAKLKLNYTFAPQKANFRNSLQQKKQLRHQQKESRCKIRHQREKANIQKGSRFHEFCRRNNLTIEFKEHISDKPIISFRNNEKPIPNHWRIKNINQKFVIKNL